MTTIDLSPRVAVTLMLALLGSATPNGATQNGRCAAGRPVLLEHDRFRGDIGAGWHT